MTNSEIPSDCPTCSGERSREIDPSDDSAEWFLWCEVCAIGEFPAGD